MISIKTWTCGFWVHEQSVLSSRYFLMFGSATFTTGAGFCSPLSSCSCAHSFPTSVAGSKLLKAALLSSDRPPDRRDVHVRVLGNQPLECGQFSQSTRLPDVFQHRFLHLSHRLLLFHWSWGLLPPRDPAPTYTTARKFLATSPPYFASFFSPR